MGREAQEYSSPAARLEPPPQRSGAAGRRLALTGSTLQLTLAGGVAWVLVETIRLAARVERQAISSPEIVAGAMSEALVPLILALLPALLGYALNGVALVALRYRARWFLVVTVFSSIFWLFFFPIGTLLAIFSLVYVVRRRRQFV